MEAIWDPTLLCTRRENKAGSESIRTTPPLYLRQLARQLGAGLQWPSRELRSVRAPLWGPPGSTPLQGGPVYHRERSHKAQAEPSPQACSLTGSRAFPDCSQGPQEQLGGTSEHPWPNQPEFCLLRSPQRRPRSPGESCVSTDLDEAPAPPLSPPQTSCASLLPPHRM